MFPIPEADAVIVGLEPKDFRVTENGKVRVVATRRPEAAGQSDHEVELDYLFTNNEQTIFGVGAGLAFWRLSSYIATPAGKEWKDTWLLRMPIFGSLFRMLAVTRFARTLSTLLQSGVPLLKAMDIVRNVIGNARLERVVDEAASAIREGQSIAAPLKRSGDFPPIVIHMIAVGEKSGQLESMLENVAKAYDTQVDTRIQALTSLLEPLMMVFMGGMNQG